ncbi:MAG: cob(I)yrinic acid a,c-diamide adenosyltransferase [Bacteroidales bacterium]|nr:cob(I)yrinic acid a,c-diamide adenosyltransferase [Bacteroidales bacterium]
MIYTRTGDQGQTSLVGGARVRKDSTRVEAYGTVDELNSHLGLLAEMIRPQEEPQYRVLKGIQNCLFIIQTLLATEDEALRKKLPPLPADAVEGLEHQIDTFNASLPQLRQFVIAGGTMPGAQCHVCRTVCRRAERRVVTLATSEIVSEEVMRYLNRLSDYLFVLARYLVVAAGAKEDVYIS